MKTAPIHRLALFRRAVTHMVSYKLLDITDCMLPPLLSQVLTFPNTALSSFLSFLLVTFQPSWVLRQGGYETLPSEEECHPLPHHQPGQAVDTGVRADQDQPQQEARRTCTHHRCCARRKYWPLSPTSSFVSSPISKRRELRPVSESSTSDP